MPKYQALANAPLARVRSPWIDMSVKSDNLIRDCSGVGQTSGLPVHGVSDSESIGSPEHRAGGPANRQTGGLPHIPT